MIRIPIAVCGDNWVNQNLVVTQLQSSDLQEPVILDLHAEGPSLYALGIVDVVLEHLQRAGQSADRVYVENWSNSVEVIPFHRMNRHLLSHFFWMSNNYQHAVPTNRTAKYLFGYFVGRRTVSRCVMLQHVQQQYPTKFLLSLMNSRDYLRLNGLDRIEDWVIDQTVFDQWWKSPNIIGLDGLSVQDQYVNGNNTNASLLSWYPTFDIELVAETYTHGDTFFPTEKTVRPMMAGKSMVIHGPERYLERLQNLGFRTWNCIWDESYDRLVGLHRWRAIQTVIDDLVSRDQEELYQQCLPVIKHNIQHAKRLIKKYQPE